MSYTAYTAHTSYRPHSSQAACWKRFPFLIAALAVAGLLVVPPSRAAEYRYGLALRENVLIMRSPATVGLAGTAPETFGISETALRGYARRVSERLSFEAALETRGSFSSSGMGIGGLSGFFTRRAPLELWDLTIEHTETAATQIRTRMENLNFTLRAGPVDFQTGRQPISLGTSHFVSVLDVIAPFAPGYLDATYKPGVDAVRVRAGLGRTSEVEIIAVGAEEWEQSALVGKVRASVLAQDIVALGGRFRERGFGGLAWEGEIDPFAIWGELGLFERKPGEEPFFGGWSEAAFSGIIGTDVFVPYDIRAGFALMYQDFGARDPEDLLAAYAAAPVREGWVFLGSAGYAVLTANRQLTPLATVNLSGLVNLVDGSTLWQPQVTFSVSDNSDLSLYGWIGSGPGPRTEGLIITPRSEFGLIPDGVGLYGRWFF
ncbi:MAG: hypothetical protein ACYC9O_05380 [Candidatus Latescibacterota bacterium]